MVNRLNDLKLHELSSKSLCPLLKNNNLLATNLASHSTSWRLLLGVLL